MSEWSKKRPTEPGKFWFFGQRNRGEKAGMHVVDVFQGANALIFVCGSQFLYGEEKGMWMPAVVPDPPSDVVDARFLLSDRWYGTQASASCKFDRCSLRCFDIGEHEEVPGKMIERVELPEGIVLSSTDGVVFDKGEMEGA